MQASKSALLGHWEPSPDGLSLTSLGLGSRSSCVRAEDRLKGLDGFSKSTSATLPTLLTSFLITG